MIGGLYEVYNVSMSPCRVARCAICATLAPPGGGWKGDLLLRGALGLTLLGVSVLSGTFDEQMPVVLFAIEPWFVLGGLAFGGMTLSQRKKPAVVGALSQ